MELRPSHILHRGAGCPVPLDAARAPIRTHAPRPCGKCDDAAGIYRFADLVTDATITLAQGREMLAGGDALCLACAWMLRDLRLRCAPFIATERGVWFVPVRGLLRALLDPPEPPFVVGAPMYGAAHGGEGNGWRATWSTEPVLPEGVDVLGRLQAKVCAPYCDTAISRDRYALQIDNALRVTVDRPLWARVVADLDTLTATCRAARCGYTETRTALTDLVLPTPARWHDPRAFAALTRAWRDLTAPLRPHRGAAWYRLIARDLYEIQTGDTR